MNEFAENRMNDDEKIDVAKEFLRRYKRQENVIDWQKQRLNEMAEIAIESSPAPQDVRVQSSKLSDPTADAAVKIADVTNKIKAKLQEERAILIEMYEEITAALSLIEDPEEREILYDIYIKGATLTAAYLTWGIHPRTAARRHRRALISLYDRLSKQNKNGA